VPPENRTKENIFIFPPCAASSVLVHPASLSRSQPGGRDCSCESSWKKRRGRRLDIWILSELPPRVRQLIPPDVPPLLCPLDSGDLLRAGFVFIQVLWTLGTVVLDFLENLCHHALASFGSEGWYPNFKLRFKLFRVAKNILAHGPSDTQVASETKKIHFVELFGTFV
jgi:hypothetical protein